MGVDLFQEILEKFLALLQQDKIIPAELADKVHEAIASGNCTKDSIELLLNADTKTNEDPQA